MTLDGEQPQPVFLGGYKITLAARAGRGGAGVPGQNPASAVTPLGAGGVGQGSRAMPADTRTFALVVNTAPDEFLFIGSNGVPSFEPESSDAPRVAISAKDEGRYEAGRWVPGRRLNGDEAGSGLPNGSIGEC